MPTPVVGGEEDMSALLAGWNEIYKGGREGLGHWSCIEGPESVADLIRAFVENVIKAD